MKFHWAAALPILVSGLLFAQFPNNPALDPLSGHNQTISIFGRVVHSNGAGAADARVTVTDLSTGRAVGSAYTNPSGNFQLGDLPAGSFELTASSGLAQSTERVDASTAAFITLRLPNDSTSADVRAPSAGTVSVADYKVPKKARDAFRKAEEAALKGKSEEADKRLAQALALYPAYSEALTFRAIRLLSGVGGQAQALTDLSAALKSDPSNARAYLVMGALFTSSHRFDDAIGMVQRGISLMPDAWQGHYELAKAYCGKADFTAALRQLRRAEEGAPKDFTGLLLLKAHVLIAMKDYREAVNALQLVLGQTRQGPQAQQAMAMLEQAKTFSATH